MASTSLAQHEGHTTPEPATAEEQQPADTHAGQAATAEPAAPADPHAGHVMSAEPAAEVDPHVGHTMPVPAADAHQGHDMATMSAGGMPAADQPPPPEAFEGPAHAADRFYDSAEMARTREGLRVENGDFKTLFVMADQFEIRSHDGEDTYIWDAQGWYGGDINKFWFKTEGEGDVDDSPEEIELQALWSHALHPWFDLQAGARVDFESGFERSHLVLGLQGLAPYRFEIDAAAFISDEGDVSARFEGEYDVWLTQRLILQPRVELELAAQDIPERSMGSGLSSGEFGARLHYQFVREFAPYLGVEYERLFSGTADAARLQGKETGGWNVVLGVRSWF